MNRANKNDDLLEELRVLLALAVQEHGEGSHSARWIQDAIKDEERRTSGCSGAETPSGSA